ncbi:hypothetical protein HY212_04060 [Candidatus Pacearchaeota archaeon]|nr:hypothetical protein [Candidatus Pacearchaeota archaeon]
MKSLDSLFKSIRNAVARNFPKKPEAYSSIADLMRSEYPKIELREVSTQIDSGRKSEFYDANSSTPLPIPKYYACSSCGYVKGSAIAGDGVYSCRRCERVLFEEFVPKSRVKVY